LVESKCWNIDLLADLVQSHYDCNANLNFFTYITYPVNGPQGWLEFNGDFNTNAVISAPFSVIDYFEEKTYFNKGKILSSIFEN